VPRKRSNKKARNSVNANNPEFSNSDDDDDGDITYSGYEDTESQNKTNSFTDLRVGNAATAMFSGANGGFMMVQHDTNKLSDQLHSDNQHATERILDSSLLEARTSEYNVHGTSNTSLH
jgi:hypothetical protein